MFAQYFVPPVGGLAGAHLGDVPPVPPLTPAVPAAPAPPAAPADAVPPRPPSPPPPAPLQLTAHAAPRQTARADSGLRRRALHIILGNPREGRSRSSLTRQR